MIVVMSMVFATGGVELIAPCLDGSSDMFGELTNGCVRAESNSVVRDRVGKTLVWHSAAP